ncbi:hypothetical protein G3O08_12430 [Cryomorpha ignava]|uniref:Uncharacterized protein n=1 Tax=Cryomorpha ignava TaxID=101383 RepID=A0A7K3WTF1_9FLAO|nr:hypothetical protein [Cryomorpha ignava]NEN24311.1 hypothetical protein [Cryomorpha ignava]
MKNYFALLLLVAIGISCTKNDDDDCGIPNPPEASENFLESLNIGDKLYYSMLIGENYYQQGEDVYSYTGDTLELEVLNISEAGVLIAQRITAGSNMMDDSVVYYWNKDSVYTNTWNIEGDSLIVESDAPYFENHLLGISRLKFSDYSEQEVEITGWRTSYSYSEANAQLFTTNYTLFNHDYDSLSVYIHNEPMSYDGNGSSFVYSKTHGIVRSSEYGWWSQSGYGWDRIY